MLPDFHHGNLVLCSNALGKHRLRPHPKKPNLKAPMHAKPRKLIPKSCFDYVRHLSLWERSKETKTKRWEERERRCWIEFWVCLFFKIGFREPIGDALTLILFHTQWLKHPSYLQNSQSDKHVCKCLHWCIKWSYTLLFDQRIWYGQSQYFHNKT